MTSFVDIHCHALFGVDDGAITEQDMYEMLRLAYENGTRTLCLTPHYDPKPGEDTVMTVEESFALATSYCEKHLPDIKLVLGNELSYRVGCMDSLLSGACRTLAGSRYVLVDFFLTPTLAEVKRGVSLIAGSGYIPVIAHVERYACLFGKIREVEAFVESGALVQVNADSLKLGVLSPVGRMARRLLAEGLVHMIASDAHNVTTRAPNLSEAYEAVRKKYGEAYAEILFSVNPQRVLSGVRIHS